MLATLALKNKQDESSAEVFEKVFLRKLYTDMLCEKLSDSIDPHPVWPEHYFIYGGARAKLCTMYSADPFIALATVFSALRNYIPSERNFEASKLILSKFKETLLAKRDMFKDSIDYGRYDKTSNESHLLKQFVRLNEEEIRYLSNKILKDVFKDKPICDLGTELKPM